MKTVSVRQKYRQFAKVYFAGKLFKSEEIPLDVLYLSTSVIVDSSSKITYGIFYINHGQCCLLANSALMLFLRPCSIKILTYSYLSIVFCLCKHVWSCYIFAVIEATAVRCCQFSAIKNPVHYFSTVWNNTAKHSTIYDWLNTDWRLPKFGASDFWHIPKPAFYM